jgi:hypothetical protein
VIGDGARGSRPRFTGLVRRSLVAVGIGLVLSIVPAVSAADQPAGEEVEDLFAPFAGSAFEPLLLREREDVPAVSQPNWSQMPVFDQIGAPGYFGSTLLPIGKGLESVTVGEGPGGKALVYVVTSRDNRVHAYDAVDPGAELFSFGSGSGPAAISDASGIAAWRGEVYVVDRSRVTPESARVVVYDGAGRYERQIPLLNPLGLGDMTGVDVSSGEVWVTGSLCGGYASVVEIFDARTGVIKGIAGHVAHSPTGDPSQLCDASYDPSAWWDLAAVPDFDSAMAGYRLVRRGLVAALSTPDPELLCYFCYRRPWQDGLDAVWGMRWLLSVDGSSRTSRGTAITEYSLDPDATTGDPLLTERRRWLPNQSANGGVRDVHYQNRETRIDWAGNLTGSDWINHGQQLDYIVSDADIYAVGDQGERWYELARNFDHLALKVDGVNHPFSVDGAPEAVTSTKAFGRLSFDTHRIGSGTHTLELVAYLENGHQVTARNDALRIDHQPPAGRLDPPGYAVRDTVVLTGDLTDEHRGPKDWRPQLTPAGQGAWSEVCGVSSPGPYLCQWDTTRHPDGRYDLRSRLNDLMTDAHDNPTYSATVGTIVDNTPPGVSVGGDLTVTPQSGPLEVGEPESLQVDATDAASGVVAIEVLVDGVSKAIATSDCTTGGCDKHLDWSLNPGDYSDSGHTVTVRARDWVGHTTERSWSFDVEYNTPETPDEEAMVRGQQAGAAGSSTSGESAANTPLAGDDDLSHTLPSCTGPTETPVFTTYDLGESFEGLPLVAKLRRCDAPFPGEPVRANYVSYIYGDCQIPEGDEACSPPIEIQSWPACERSLADYSFGPEPGEEEFPHENIVRRGVPGALFDAERRLELYTGGTTVVVFGDDPAQVSRAADAVRSVASGLDSLLGDGGPLPAPAKGAVEGSLSCAG